MSTAERRPQAEAPFNNQTASHQAAPSTVESNAPAGDASRRRDRIKLLIGSMTTTTEKLGELLDAALAAGDHAALGYASWTSYIAGEFSGSLTGLTIALRREAVGTLTGTGMSSRAIAEITDVSHSTIVRDQQQVVHDAPPAADGPRPASAELDAELDAELGAPPRRITGTDGKSYPTTPPAPPRPPRRGPCRDPLPDVYRDAVYDLGKVVSRLARLHRDDRFAANRFSVRGRNHGPLARHCDELGALLAELTGGAR